MYRIVIYLITGYQISGKSKRGRITGYPSIFKYQIAGIQPDTRFKNTGYPAVNYWISGHKLLDIRP